MVSRLQSPESMFQLANTLGPIGDVSCLLDLHNAFIRDFPIHSTGVVSDELVSMLTTSLGKASSRVRQLINNFSPIHRLPFEILSRVFALVPVGYTAHTMCDVNAKPAHILGPFAVCFSELLLMMKVCHRWRDTLTHCNNLWAVIDDKMFNTKTRTLYPPYLHRNPTTSVSVYVSGSGSNQTRKLLRESPERVVELRVSDLGTSASRTSLNLLTFAATELLVCTLAKITLARKPGTLKLFKGHAPRLRALRLESVYFIPANSFPSLQHLFIDFPEYLHYWRNPPEGPYTLTQLLTFLRGCASLKTLYLRNVGGQRVREIPEAAQEDSRVSLPLLQRLSVQEEYRHAYASSFQIAIFTHLFLPHNCHIHVPVQWNAGLHTLMNAVAGCSDRRASRMQLFANGNVPFGRDSIQLADDQGCQTVEIHLPLRYYAYPIMACENFRQMWSSELFRGITTLHIAPMPFLLFLHDPHSIHHTLPNLEALAISNPQRQAISLLTALIPGVGDDIACPVKFPKLTTLCLPEITLDDLPDLYAIVESRERAGHPIKHLAVSLDVTSVEPAVDQLYAITQLHDLLADHFTWTGKDKSKPGDVPIHSLPAEFMWTYPADCTQDSPWISRPVWQAWPRDP